MSTIGVDIRGIPEVQTMLGKLEGPTAKRVLQKATTAGGKLLKKAVQAEAPKGKTGRLRRSISARQSKPETRPGTVISPRSKVAFYRHMVIGGTRDHGPRRAKALVFIGQDGRNVITSRVRGVKPNPFIARGFDRGQAAAMAAIEKVVDDYLNEIAGA